MLTLTFFLTKIKLLLIHFHGLSALMNLSIPVGEIFVLNDSVSKGLIFASDPFLVVCFLQLPPLPVCDTNPTDYQCIFTKQNGTDELLQKRNNFSDPYFNKKFDDKELICCVSSSDGRDRQWEFA